MKTVTLIARQFGLSRSTLLYYDRIRLLSPSYRAHGDTRLYSAEDVARLQRIMIFRQAGLSLESIKTILAAAMPARVNRTLAGRLAEIQAQIDRLRGQQRFIIELLRQAVMRGESPKRTKDQWVELLRACAFSEAEMGRWHATMERDDPAAHARFLKRIGLAPAEVEHVRLQSRTAWAVPETQETASASAARPNRRL